VKDPFYCISHSLTNLVQESGNIEGLQRERYFSIVICGPHPSTDLGGMTSGQRGGKETKVFVSKKVSNLPQVGPPGPKRRSGKDSLISVQGTVLQRLNGGGITSGPRKIAGP